MPSSPDTASLAARPRARVIGAVLEGWRRVLRAPALTIGLLALTWASTLPLAMVLDRAMQTQLGSSAEADRALSGWNREWAADFAGSSHGLEGTFTHDILGFGGTLSALSTFVDAAPVAPALAAGIAVYLALWIFVTGGILDRIARGRPVGAAGFFAACGMYVFRLLRLAVPIGAAYWALFAWVHPFLFTTLNVWWAGSLTSEPRAIAVRAALYAIFLTALFIVSLVADFTKLRMVVEDRRSVIGALGAGMRFIRRRAWRVAGLYLLNILVALILVRLWLQVAPTAVSPDWWTIFISQAYLVVRLWARLGFMASEVVFFQGELAHAQYTAAPEPMWPDSAGVEAIRNLRG